MVESELTISQPVGLSHFQNLARKFILEALSKIQFGQVMVTERFGSQDFKQVFGSDNSLFAEVDIHDPDFYKTFISGGSIAAGEAYMDGMWSSPDLSKVMQLMAKNLNTLDAMNKRRNPLTTIAFKLGHWLNRNTLGNSKKNIEAHYDLGNDLYKTFLDTNMLYSSAIYKADDESLHQAQINKMERLCQQLNITEKDHVVEIGTGWGAMAIYMAKQYDCRVTTTTISEEQYNWAQERIAQEGLEDKITLLKRDYRDLEGRFDKLVSIEMIEAVGKQFLPNFLKKCESLLKPGGLMAIQAITIADQRYDYYSQNVDFIQKYIFPGGFLPSVSALAQTSAKNTSLVVKDLFDIGIDYARTLADWREQFELAKHHLSQLGYDERFVRMWRYYLCYCEGGFRAQSISTVQMTFRRGE